MKRLSILTIAVAALGSLAIGIAWAANPHCITTSSSIDNSGDLSTCFKIAGFGNSETVHVTVTADVTAVYACRNNGGNCPSAANKSTASGPVSASGDFTANRNGQVTGCLTLGPLPSPPAPFCPPGQRQVLACATFGQGTLSFSGGTGSGSCIVPASSVNRFPGCTGLCD
jgi:hypothetical protein